jgi:hypothetical protein
MKKILLYCFVLLTAINCTNAQKETTASAKQPFVEKSVRFVYLVSKDRKHNPAYEKAIAMAAKDIQGWYKKQLKGYTFKLNDPIVEVAYSEKKADYFYSNPNGEDKTTWGYNNTYEEAQKGDKDYIWVIYSDGPGDRGRGGNSVCIMPEDDLLGLTGKHVQQPDIKRWIGGLGHEAGHAFGLPHPDDTKKDNDALMWAGLYNGKYPDICYLTPQDKENLSNSAFFFDDKGINIAANNKVVATYKYDTGKFVRFFNAKRNKFSWKEINNNGENDFLETQKDKDLYYLKATNRDLEIKIPLKNGQSFLSTDKRKTWTPFKNMTQ